MGKGGEALKMFVGLDFHSHLSDRELSVHSFVVSLGISAFPSAAFPGNIGAHVLPFAHVSFLVVRTDA